MRTRRLTMLVLSGVAVILFTYGSISAIGAEDSLPKGFPPWEDAANPLTKEYPSFRIAKAEGRVFETLAKLIARHDIPMTAPVMYILDPDESYPDKVRFAATAFFYPNTTVGKLGYDGPVVVEDWEKHTVLSIAFTGKIDLPMIRSKIDLLEKRFADPKGQYVRVGPYRLLSYDPPFVEESKRRHELQAPVMTTADWRAYQRSAPSEMGGKATPAVQQALETLAKIAEEWGKPEKLEAYKESLTKSGMVYMPPNEVATALRGQRTDKMKRAVWALGQLKDDRIFQPLTALMEHPNSVMTGHGHTFRKCKKQIPAKRYATRQNKPWHNSVRNNPCRRIRSNQFETFSLPPYLSILLNLPSLLWTPAGSLLYCMERGHDTY